MAGRSTIVGWPVARGRANLVNGAAQYECDRCGALCWLAPSGQEMAADGWEVICLDCGQAEGAPYTVLATPRAVAELQHHLGRDN